MTTDSVSRDGWLKLLRSSRRKALCLLHLLIWSDHGVSAIRDAHMNEDGKQSMILHVITVSI